MIAKMPTHAYMRGLPARDDTQSYWRTSRFCSCRGILPIVAVPARDKTPGGRLRFALSFHMLHERNMEPEKVILEIICAITFCALRGRSASTCRAPAFQFSPTFRAAFDATKACKPSTLGFIMLEKRPIPLMMSFTPISFCFRYLRRRFRP